jgi:hypothetical protein
LFATFIVAWRSLSKLVISISIHTGSKDAKDAYNRAITTPDIHDDKSHTLNALAGLHTQSVFGIMAQNELRDVKSTDILDFLKSQVLCARCREVVGGQGRQVLEGQERREAESWGLVFGLLEWHMGTGQTEECRAKLPFRWTRNGSGGVEALLSDDPNIAIAILHGGLGAWRFKQASFSQRLSKIILLLAILFPLCFGFQLISATFVFVIPIYGYFGTAQNGTTYYQTLNTAVPSGLYLANGTLVYPLASAHIQPSYLVLGSIMAAAFIASGVVAFIVGGLEARAAQRTYPSRVLSARALRMISCGIMALYSGAFGVFLSINAGYNKSDNWPNGLQYTLALLISGILLSGPYVWRARNGMIGDTKSWATPLFTQSIEVPVQLPARADTSLLHFQLPAWFISWRNYVQWFLGNALGGLRARMNRSQQECPVTPPV